MGFRQSRAQDEGISPIKFVFWLLVLMLCCVLTGIAVVLVAPTVIDLVGNHPVAKFNPLPPPVFADNEANLALEDVQGTEQAVIDSSFFGVSYHESGADVGKTSSEVFRNYQTGEVGTAYEVTLGDWREGVMRYTFSKDPNGCLIEGRVFARIDGASILQWAFGDIDRTLDRSTIVFQYVALEPCATPTLVAVLYQEQWSLGGKDPLAMGAYSVWNTGLDALFPGYTEFGFWENTASPYSQVDDMLEAAEAALKTQKPDFQAVDRDSVKEIIGRQTGLTLYRDGAEWGKIAFSYKNNLGAMPNTKGIGKGALSQVTWQAGDKDYYLMVLSPALAVSPTSLFVFTDSSVAVDQINQLKSQGEWPLIYSMIRNHELPGDTFGIYESGFIGDLTVVVPDANDYPQTKDIGDGGGIFYSTIGADQQKIQTAYQWLSLLGPGGTKATGFYYASEPGSGNGIVYYLASLLISQGENSLYRYGQDVGLLDRVGFPELDAFPRQ